MIFSDSNTDSNGYFDPRVRIVVDPTLYMNRTGLKLFIDSHIVDAADEVAVTLRKLREVGWISLQRTDTMDTEFGKAAGEQWTRLTEVAQTIQRRLAR